ncbi:hypothetical protein [Glaciecola sp. 1036]|uniref:hypothetical protein n=1 Tax=Alteromonadaceae TaxID=72275 RepID=UPI003D03B566
MPSKFSQLRLISFCLLFFTLSFAAQAALPKPEFQYSAEEFKQIKEHLEKLRTSVFEKEVATATSNGKAAGPSQWPSYCQGVIFRFSRYPQNDNQLRGHIGGLSTCVQQIVQKVDLLPTDEIRSLVAFAEQYEDKLNKQERKQLTVTKTLPNKPYQLSEQELIQISDYLDDVNGVLNKQGVRFNLCGQYLQTIKSGRLNELRKDLLITSVKSSLLNCQGRLSRLKFEAAQDIQKTSVNFLSEYLTFLEDQSQKKENKLPEFTMTNTLPSAPFEFNQAEYNQIWGYLDELYAALEKEKYLSPGHSCPTKKPFSSDKNFTRRFVTELYPCLMNLDFAARNKARVNLDYTKTLDEAKAFSQQYMNEMARKL